MTKSKVSTFADLFGGIGGFRIACESHGLKCIFTSEWDKYSQKTYFENFGETPNGDITKINEKDIPYHDVLCAGFPCQSFSVSGKQAGFSDTRGTLFFDIARIVAYHKPKVLFLENVKNFARHDNGNTLKKVEEVLEGLGYNVFFKVLNASNFGVPTARERIYIVCFLRELGINSFEFPSHVKKNIYVKDIIEDGIDVSKYEIKRNDIKITKEEPKEFVNYPVQIGKINNGGQGERIYSIKGHAITLSAHGGGAASKTGAYLVDGMIRKLTPRECARVMGFNDDFKIPVSDAQAYKQFGNSVAVPVLKEIMAEILKNLEKNNE